MSIIDSETLSITLAKAQCSKEPIITITGNFTPDAFDLLSQLMQNALANLTCLSLTNAIIVSVISREHLI